MGRLFPTTKFIICLIAFSVVVFAAKWAVDSCLTVSVSHRVFSGARGPDFICTKVISADLKSQSELQARSDVAQWTSKGNGKTGPLPGAIRNATYFTQVLFQPTQVLRNFPFQVVAVAQVILFVLFAALGLSLLWELVGALALNSINAYDMHMLEKSRRMTATFQVLFPESYRPTEHVRRRAELETSDVSEEES